MLTITPIRLTPGPIQTRLPEPDSMAVGSLVAVSGQSLIEVPCPRRANRPPTEWLAYVSEQAAFVLTKEGWVKC